MTNQTLAAALPVERDAASTQWLAEPRTMLPDALPDFVDRRSLAGQLGLTRRRITVVNAPGGFGKTSSLAQACRGLRKRGDIIAWVTVAEDDDPTTLVTYLLRAFASAGLELVDAVADGVAEDDVRLDLLLRSIDAHGGPCVLVLDEVDRLRIDETVSLLNRIMQTGPANLHVAMACRELPDKLAITPWLLEGRGIIVSVEELRFERSEIDRLFDRRLSSEQLHALTTDTEGWPIALRLRRNLEQLHRSPEETAQVALNWLWTSFFRGLAAEDRDLVLDAGLFDWADTALLDAALGPGSMRRLVNMPTLAGLLHPVGDGQVVGLHPLVRELCSRRLSADSPKRFRRTHRRIAEALANRGHTLPAMRHADKAEDPDLVARIMEDAGGIRLWLRHGVGQLQKADELVTGQMLQRYPRLLMARCALLLKEGQLLEALELYSRVRGSPAGLDPRDEEDQDLGLDMLLVQGIGVLYGCAPLSSSLVEQLIGTYRDIADAPRTDRLVRGVLRFGLALYEHQGANFDIAHDWIEKSLQDLSDTSHYMTMFVRFLKGVMEFARGRAAQARAEYAYALDIAKREFISDTSPLVFWQAFSGELDLEGTGTASLGRGRLKKLEDVAAHGAWLDTFAAAAYASSEVALANGEAERALEELNDGLAFARRTGRPALLRALAALYASMLVRSGRLADAEWLWGTEALPVEAAECADLERQTWREMECICCGRVRLLLAAGDLEAARVLADAFADGARAKNLRRSLTWALALSVAVAEQAGDRARSLADLTECLHLCSETSYRLALVALRQFVLSPLKQLAGDAPVHDVAVDLIRAMEAAERPDLPDPVPTLTAREIDVLRHLGHAQDKEIANALGISANGVRYHLKNIFRKLGVDGRQEAVRRASELGLAGAPAFYSPPTAPLAAK